MGNLDRIDTRSIAPSVYSVSAHASPVSHTRATSPTGSFASHTSRRPFADTPSPDPHTPNRSHEFRHPYANPEFARGSPSPAGPSPSQHSPSQHLEELHNLANSNSYASSLSPSESNATLTEASSAGCISQASSGSTISLTPVPSPQPKTDLRHLHGRGGPINKSLIRALPQSTPPDSHRPTPPPAMMNAMPGWSDNSASAIKLITLEEAQAQARERSRTATGGGSTLTSPTSARFNDVEPLPSPTSSTWSSRIRSSSASSSKMKSSLSDVAHHAPPPLPSYASEQTVHPPRPVVVRKKSGFMRLLTGTGKERASPPPVPSISNTSLPSPSSINSFPVSRKNPPHRVPVPSLSPSLDQSDSFNANAQYDLDHNQGREQLNARRNAPGLSIVTSTSSPNGRPRGRSISPCASDATHVATSLTPTTATTNTDSFLDGSVPNSAPPTSADFLGLRLRPVSTMFSTDFGGHLVHRTSSDQSRPSLDIDSGTPTTSSGISPLSPGFSVDINSRPGYEKSIVGIASHQDDQSAVIQALQEQIMVARRAWQRQIWELEGQVRDLKAEVEEFRSAEDATEYCTACGRGSMGRPQSELEVGVEDLKKAGVQVGGIVNRPRARTGVGSRFASGT